MKTARKHLKSYSNYIIIKVNIQGVFEKNVITGHSPCYDKGSVD